MRLLARSRSIIMIAIVAVPLHVRAHDGIVNLDGEPALPAYAERLTESSFATSRGRQPQGEGGMTLVEEGPDGVAVTLHLDPISGDIRP